MRIIQASYRTPGENTKSRHRHNLKQLSVHRIGRMSGNMVTISAERLKHLEELEAKIPAMINIVNKYNKTKDDKLRKLHERQKANPDTIHMTPKNDLS